MEKKENPSTTPSQGPKKLEPIETPDLTQEKIAMLREIFPNCVTEGEDGLAVEWETLRQELSPNLIEGHAERYLMTWPGRRKAILGSALPAKLFLRPIEAQSVDFENTANLYIEGDNLDALKMLGLAYFECVKMIYIDPPYNTGNDFIYKDDFKASAKEHKLKSQQIDEKGGRLVSNPQSNGRFHSNWLSMMYPRLKLAKRLLSKDGVILVNIDEHEFANLSKIMDDIFGENNSLGVIVWDKRNPKGDSRKIASQHEYIFSYARNIDELVKKHNVQRPKKNATQIIAKAVRLFGDIKKGKSLEEINKDFRSWLSKQDKFSGGEKSYSKIDENGRVYRGVSMAWPNDNSAPSDYRIPILHPVTKKQCNIPSKGWRYPSATIQSLISQGLILFGEDENTQPQRKYFLDENMYENVPSVLYYGGSDSDLLKELGIQFNNPKVTEICKEHISIFTDKDSLILDFFSGSATMAQAVMELNAEDGGNRRYILVQLPEATAAESEARKAGYATIAEIGKERIRRAAQKIQKETGAEIDYGFRVMRLEEREKPGHDLFSYEEGIPIDELTRLFQLMLSKGIPLHGKVKETRVRGKKVYDVDNRYLLASFEDKIDLAFAHELAALGPRAISLLESSLGDQDKVNIKLSFGRGSSRGLRPDGIPIELWLL